METKINPLNNSNNTVVNSSINKSTVINSAIGSANSLPLGTVLNDKYVIKNKLNVSTGEADLYICEYEGAEYIAKVYRRSVAIKPEVVEAIKSLRSPYVATIFETDTINGFPYEILPYYKQGSLQGRRYTFEGIKNYILPCINEGLKALHSIGIVHKDLKPSNIMLLDNNKGVAIIDFGISSVMERGNTVLVTKTGMTPEYSAPETFRNLFLDESDYYSLGITLYELFTGNTPYKNMSAEEIAQYTAVQRIPFPENMPVELQNLITGITYFDITNRNNKKNPNRRWTYDEVKKWCEGKKQAIPGEGVYASSISNIPAYSFNGQKYSDMVKLVAAFGENWKDGKKQLYRGLMSGFFKTFDPEIAGYCLDAEEEASKSGANDDLVFWNLLYKISPDSTAFYWNGRVYENLVDLGDEILNHLRCDNKSEYAFWSDILSNGLISSYAKRLLSENKDLIEALKGIESTFKYSKSDRETLIAYYLLGYILSGKKTLIIGKNEFDSVDALAVYMKELLDRSYDDLEKFCHKMIAYDDTLDAQFEAWLISIGKRDELENWKKEL